MNRARSAQRKRTRRGALLQDNELVPQYPYFGFQPPPRPEAVVQQPDEKQANCDHQPQSCSDSVAAATPAAGVFGSDTRKQVCDSPLHGLAWLAAQEQHDQPGGVTRDRRKPAMGGRHASCDIGPRHHNHVSLTLPDFGRSRAKSDGVLQGQECQYLHPLSLSAPSMITYSCTPCWLLGDQADRGHSSV